MKKIFISIAALAAMTFTSCGNQTAQGGDNDSIDTVVVEETGVKDAQAEAETIVSSLADQLKAGNAEGIQAKIEEVKAYIAELLNNDKLEAATAYASQIQKFLDENKDKLDEYTNGTASKLSDALSKAGGLENVASGLLEAVSGKANEAADAAKSAIEEKANEAVEAAKAKAEEKAKEAVENAKSKAYEEGKKAGEDAKAKVKDAASKAADEAKKALGI